MCSACQLPLLDDQPCERIFSADQPYRHSDPVDCPALRERLAADAAQKRSDRGLRAV